MKNAPLPLRKTLYITLFFQTLAALGTLFFVSPFLSELKRIKDDAEFLNQMLIALAGNNLGWKITWACWLVGTAAMVIFFMQWESLVRDTSRKCLARAGFLLCALGAVPDLISIAINLLPIVKLAEIFTQLPTPPFAAPVWPVILETLVYQSLALGGLGYAVGGLMLSHASLDSDTFPPGLAKSGYLVWGLGLALSLMYILEMTIGRFAIATIHMVFLLWWYGAWIVFTYKKPEKARTCCG